MNDRGRVLLLVGSPRGAKSTSASLGTYLLHRLEGKGFGADTLYIAPPLLSGKRTEQMLSAVDGARIIVLASPLYIDSVPAPVIRAMELIRDHRAHSPAPNEQRLLVIVNSGFPEVRHNFIALEIYKRFAKESGFTWAGGLALGMGEAIAGEPLERRGGMTLKVRHALETAAGALAEGHPVPPEAVALMARPFIPIWMYVLFGRIGWRQKALKNGVWRGLSARPYEEPA